LSPAGTFTLIPNGGLNGSLKTGWKLPDVNLNENAKPTFTDAVFQNAFYFNGKMSLTITIVTREDEIQQILTLQQSNLATSISERKAKEQGFVTVKHSFNLLQMMNNVAPQVIAKSGDNVIGYALMMPETFKDMIPVLKPMFATLKSLSWCGATLDSVPFYIMGQICISDNYRGQGIFDRLYAKHRELYADEYQMCITEVSNRNQRSMKAHHRVGFDTIHTFTDMTDTWSILAWKWN
jgi:hypothetical protein